MTTIAEALVEVRADTSSLRGDVSRGVTAATVGAGGSTSSSGRRLGSGMGVALMAGMGSVLLGGAGIAGLVGISAVKAEAAYSRTMNVLQATTRSSRAEMKLLDELAIQTGKDTVFSAGDAANAMLELARGGIKPAQIEAGALKGTMTLAAAGQLDMASAANVAVQAMGAFNLKGKDMDSIAAALAGSANSSSASVGDIGMALGQSGLAAKSAGLNIQETTAVLAAFSNQGLQGSDAGTSLKTMLSNLVPTTKDAKEAMDKYNLSFVDGKGNFKDISDIAGQLKDRFGDMGEAERSAALETIFGSDARRAALALVEEGQEGIEKYTKATSDQTAAEEAAEAQTEGTAGAMEAFGGMVETVQIQLGKFLAPAVTKGLRWITGAIEDAIPHVQDFAHWIGETVGKSWDMGDAMEDGGAIVDDVKRAWKGLQPFLKEAGETLIPVIVGAIKLQIKWWKVLADVAIFFWNNALGPTLKLSTKAFAILLEHIADTLDVLGSIPGAPDWIQETADKAHAAANQINEVSESIHKIPPRKDVHVNIFETTFVSRRKDRETSDSGMGGPQDAVDTNPRTTTGTASRTLTAPRGDRTTAGRTSARGGGGTVRLKITNWREGTGLIQGIAASEADDANAYGDRLGRMGR